MHERQKVGGGNIEEGASGECGRKSREYFTGVREEYVCDIESDRCCESE